MKDATGTQICEDLAIRVEMRIGRHMRILTEEQNRRRAAIMDCASRPLSERPTTAVDRRQHAIAVVLYKHVDNGPYDLEAIELDLMNIRAMGRTSRWKASIATWIRMLNTRDIEWALDQGAINANYAAF